LLIIYQLFENAKMNELDENLFTMRKYYSGAHKQKNRYHPLSIEIKHLHKTLKPFDNFPPGKQ